MKAVEPLDSGPAASGATNRLLADLPRAERSLIDPALGSLLVHPGQVLLDPAEVPREAIFPLGGTVLTVLAVTPDRKPVETAMIGAEGAAGALFGPTEAACGFRVQVLTEGMVLRIPAERFAAALADCAVLRERMGHYAMARLAQTQIGVACAALHPVEARAARWMLDLQARLGERSLPVTQEALSDLLGVRRTTITRVVATLEAREVVRHRRGRIIVMDRDGLARSACECHARGMRHLPAWSVADDSRDG